MDKLLSYANIARSVYYYYYKKIHIDKYSVEKEIIKEVFQKNNGRYGYRKIQTVLKQRGYHLNHKTVRKLMKQLGLKCQIRIKKYKSYKGTVGHIAPNVIERNFKSEAPNRKWATDITMITIKDTRLYLSPIIDMYNGEIISYTISQHPNMELVMNMLDAALKRRNLKGTILHSDQGFQYQNKLFVDKLKRKGMIQSMSRKGNCLDNAKAEGFFGIMKSELLYLQKFDSPEHFIKALDEYITYYNNDRIKLCLNGMSPVQYRLKYQQI